MSAVKNVHCWESRMIRPHLQIYPTGVGGDWTFLLEGFFFFFIFKKHLSQLSKPKLGNNFLWLCAQKQKSMLNKHHKPCNIFMGHKRLQRKSRITKCLAQMHSGSGGEGYIIVFSPLHLHFSTCMHSHIHIRLTQFRDAAHSCGQ